MPYYAPLTLPDLVFAKGETVDYSVSKDAMVDALTFPCATYILTTCYLYRIGASYSLYIYVNGQSASLNSFSTYSALEYYHFFKCDTNCSSYEFYSNAFKISVVTCVSPSIVSSNVATSYQFYVQSSFS